MSEIDLPILISQLPNLQQVAGPQIVPADAQQMLFGEIVAKEQQEAQQKVQTVEKDELTALSEDSGGNKNSGQQAGSRKRRNPEQAEPDGLQASNASPWAGNIINVKI